MTTIQRTVEVSTPVELVWSYLSDFSTSAEWDSVIEHDPGCKLVLEGGNDTVHTRDELLFSATPTGGTVVTYTVDVRLHGPAKVGQVLMPLVMKRIADQGAAGMHRTW